jgi:nucleoside-diphosphate kinase
MLKLDRAKAELHYAEHREKPFFDDLVNFITSKGWGLCCSSSKTP